MMEKEQLRRADFVTSILLILFGGWVLLQAFQMPMKDTYGGVRNVWYVSPALLPILVGSAIAVLGTVLLIHSIRTGGAGQVVEGVRHFRPGLSDAGLRFLAILLALTSFVFLFIPRIDFFLSIALFLLYFVAAFFFDDTALLKKATLVYAGQCVFILLAYLSGIAGLMNSGFRYSMDVVALVFLVILWVSLRRISAGNQLLRKRLRVSMIVSLVTPAILAPVFRYLLLVPLPREGGIIELMNLVYYSLR